MSTSEFPPKCANRDNDEIIECAPPSANEEPSPPSYTPLNESLRWFSINAPFINAASERNDPSPNQFTPRYQLSCDFTRSGQPFLLKIRRLLRSEIRSIDS